jgi:hypothetical protein
MDFVAKGTLYDAVGGVVASDVWFTFDSFMYSYTVNLGTNVKGSSSFMELTSYGSGGSISAMSGPVVEYTAWQVSSFYATAIYSKGVSVSTYTIVGNTTPITLDTGRITVGSGHLASVAPTVKMTGPNSSSEGWAGLAAAVLVALVLISSLLLLDRRRSAP